MGASILGLLVIAHHMKEYGKSPGLAKKVDTTPPAPIAGMWLASGQGGGGAGKVGRRRHDDMGVDYWIREAPGWRTGQGD